MEYPSDLKSAEWDLIAHYFDCGKYGNRRKYPIKMLVNAVFYLTKTGCQWRQLPNDFPPWKTVYSFYFRTKQKGNWEKIMVDLVGRSRKKQGKKTLPTYSLIDSQSVKTTSHGLSRGIDGGKKIKGRKRHIVTDTQGHLLHVKVHAANIHDTVSGQVVFYEACEKYPTIKGVCADAGYRKTTEGFVKKVMKKSIEISARIKNEWSILPKRWVVERTFSWLNHYRRLAKDFEVSVSSAEHHVMIAHSMLLFRRLRKP